jgi:predicted RecB family nuclease
MITDEVIENFVICKYKSYLKLKGTTGEISDYESMITNNLTQYKIAYLKNIKEIYQTENLTFDYPFDPKEKLKNNSIIINPKFQSEKYKITFDALELLLNKKDANKTEIVPVLIFPHDTISKYEKLIGTMKVLIIMKDAEVEIEKIKLVYGAELKSLKYSIRGFVNEALRLLKELSSEHVLEEPMLYKKNHCKICEFRNICHKKLVENDSLGLLSRMDDAEITRQNKRGIFTVNQLSYTFKPRKRSKRFLSKHAPYSFSLQALAIREQKVYVFETIKIPKIRTQVFIDMEGSSEGKNIYLVGMLIIDGETKIFQSLWSDDVETEILRKMINIISKLNNPLIFYYGDYESKVFKRITTLYPNNTIKKTFQEKSINILTLIFGNIYFPTYSNSLKDIGNYLGHHWSNPISSGIQSIVWRRHWQESKNIEIKNELMKYNEEDCRALHKLVDFINAIFSDNFSEEVTKKEDGLIFVSQMDYDDERKIFKELKYASKDIEVITKQAYFEYQRNKIYFRTNPKIKKIVKLKEKQKEFRYKPDKIITIKSIKCPKCKSKAIVRDESKFYQRICFDLHLFSHGIKRKIILYKIYFHFCPECRLSYVPIEAKKIKIYALRDSNAKKYIMQKGFGHNLLAWTVHQNVVNGITFENLQSTAKDYFGLQIGYRRFWDIKILASEYYSSTYKQILKSLISGNIIHADETKIKLKNETVYVWTFTNMEDVYYLYKPTREADFLHDLLKDFKGIIISDFYAGYDSLDCKKQKCLIHLIRALNDILLKNLYDIKFKEFVLEFGNLIRTIIQTIDRYGLKKYYLRKHKNDVDKFFKKFKDSSFDAADAEKIFKRIIKYRDQIFLFLDYDNVPWNNNNAEFAIKQVANYRRFVKGCIGKEGFKAHLILLSIQQTCDYKGINFLDFLHSKQRDIEKFEKNYKRKSTL